MRKGGKVSNVGCTLQNFRGFQRCFSATQRICNDNIEANEAYSFAHMNEIQNTLKKNNNRNFPRRLRNHVNPLTFGKLFQSAIPSHSLNEEANKFKKEFEKPTDEPSPYFTQDNTLYWKFQSLCFKDKSYSDVDTFSIPVDEFEMGLFFANPDLPLHIDLGCGEGEYLLEIAKDHLGEQNYLGVDIRSINIELALKKYSNFVNQKYLDKHEKIKFFSNKNLHYSTGNSIVTLKELEKLHIPNINLISVQFPDPWFKIKHNKRLMVDDGLIASIYNNLCMGGDFLFKTDVKNIFESTEDIMAAAFKGKFCKVQLPPSSPALTLTDRQKKVIQSKGDIYQSVYRKE